MNLWALFKSLFTSARRVTALDAAGRVRTGEAVLIDIREPREWVSGVAQHAALLPLTDLTPGLYVLHVEGKSRVGSDNAASKDIQIRIK